MISLLHATRSRPDKSFRTTQQWINRAGVDVELIVSLDSDDPRLHNYLLTYPRPSPYGFNIPALKNIHIIVNENRSAVDAVNQAAKHAKGNILVVLSDDTECPLSWGKLVESATEGRHDFVLKVNDGVQKWIITQPILDRMYYDRFGYVYHPDFLHMFVDTQFTHVADALGKVIWRNDILFPHRHYSVLRQRPDEINRRADATWDQGKHLYIKMLRENLGLPKDVDILRLSHYAKDHLKWLRLNAKI